MVPNPSLPAALAAAAGGEPSGVPGLVGLAVLGAAVLHAVWNALAKSAEDHLVGFVVLDLAAGALALAATPLLPAPRPAAWPYLAAGVGLHAAYQAFLVGGYRLGDLNQVYPIARGTAPVAVAVIAVPAAGERLGGLGFVGLLLVAGGLVALVGRPNGPPVPTAWAGPPADPPGPGTGATGPRAEPGGPWPEPPEPAGGRAGPGSDPAGPGTGPTDLGGGRAGLGTGERLRLAGDGRRAVLFAFATGLVIAAYTVVDGLGVRRAGSAAGYAAWLLVADAIPVPAYALARRTTRARVRAAWRTTWRRASLGGALALAAYGIVLWAQTRATLAAVAALRETSVVVAALIGATVFGEGLGRRRLAAAVIVTAGVVLLDTG